MRLIVIGSPQQRQELAEQIDSAVPDIVGEFGSLAQARESGVDADAFLLTATPVTDLDGDPAVESLTPREIEVLELVSEGLSNKAVAARLGISDQTVKFHLATISGKLGAVNRTDAVRRAVRRGLITL
ncbi:MAG TPA: helix-turn-helix transcriptional regulator [Vicinamibacterales bacterium]|jgi:DNA-binding NarL/FixJ family response regulator|nr:helix-turn-helix transcriptional regulator [Vicinamibacterales bacterium]